MRVPLDGTLKVGKNFLHTTLLDILAGSTTFLIEFETLAYPILDLLIVSKIKLLFSRKLYCNLLSEILYSSITYIKMLYRYQHNKRCIP